MSIINLLPWRENLREEQKREFLTMLVASSVLAVVVMIFLHLVISGFIAWQNSRNEELSLEIRGLDEKITEIRELQKQKKLLTAQINVIQTLQLDRPEVVRLFDELPRILPEGMVITSMKRQADQISLTGLADSNTRISTFMRNIQAAMALTQPVLTEIKTDNSAPAYNNSFSLQADLNKPLSLRKDNAP